MQLSNTFTVPVPVDTAWPTLLDVERIAPCLPGASVDQIDGEQVKGQVKVKLGPIAMTYRGTVTFVQRDESNHRVVLAAAAQETRGSGTVKATVAASMEPNGGETRVTVVTDLQVTGKPAQFGRGIMADVSQRIIGQFAENLAREIHTGRVGAAANGQVAAVSAPNHGGTERLSTSPGQDREAANPPSTAEASLDVLSLISGPARRMSVAFLVGVTVGWLLRRFTARNTRCRD